jgi:type VI protein secretion system component Hcp
MDETKKPEQQEQNKESAPNEELSSKELDQVAGGGLSLTYGEVEWVYTQQKADGTVAPAPEGSTAAKWDISQNKPA